MKSIILYIICPGLLIISFKGLGQAELKPYWYLAGGGGVFQSADKNLIGELFEVETGIWMTPRSAFGFRAFIAQANNSQPYRRPLTSSLLSNYTDSVTETIGGLEIVYHPFIFSIGTVRVMISEGINFNYSNQLNFYWQLSDNTLPDGTVVTDQTEGYNIMEKFEFGYSLQLSALVQINVHSELKLYLRFHNIGFSRDFLIPGINWVYYFRPD